MKKLFIIFLFTCLGFACGLIIAINFYEPKEIYYEKELPTLTDVFGNQGRYYRLRVQSSFDKINYWDVGCLDVYENDVTFKKWRESSLWDCYKGIEIHKFESDTILGDTVIWITNNTLLKSWEVKVDFDNKDNLDREVYITYK